MPVKEEMFYSDVITDDFYEYRTVIVPNEIMKRLLPNRTGRCTEKVWRGIGITQSLGWINFMFYEPEPHVFVFKRPKGTSPTTGIPPIDWIPPKWETDNVFLTLKHALPPLKTVST